MDHYRRGELVFDVIDEGPTAALFEGKRRAGIDISVFVVRTPPARAVDCTPIRIRRPSSCFEGNGRWTAGETVVEMHPDQMLVVPPNTPHGFRNIGDVPLLTVSIHESGELDQTFLGVIRPDARRGSRG